ncbi:DUF418 domain-containing protein [Streptomyces cyaneochromogenes]|uniref:DUF418 domain-containing protein n=1 Tax=Streptomyces cyaneochromogenes TaxID=2496836 RepID=A0A3S9MFI7_9ACTN|nr:DUF418 domain-containing protein [Streptomyces cyaneochromogenes]AZQ37959.1 DUF418 domain-containing protein [Streptomyces cyaneochromogenes]
MVRKVPPVGGVAPAGRRVVGGTFTADRGAHDRQRILGRTADGETRPGDSALFAVLAGFTLVIITGRPSPRTGRDGRQAAGRVVTRGVVLIALGFALTALDTSIDVILSFYGLIFLVVLPLYRLRATTLAVIAAGALVLPQVLYGVQQSIYDGAWSDTVIAWDPPARIGDSDGFTELLFTGEYPVLTWAPFMIAAMAVARLDLTDAKVRARLALTGGALAVVGYGGSWLALRLVPQARTVIADATDGGSASSAWWSDTVGDITDSTPPQWLLVAAPHSQTTFSLLGNAGVALVVVAAGVTVADRTPRVMRLLRPAAAVGMVALSAYVLHVVAVRVLGTEGGSMSALPVLSGYIAGAMVFAMVWTRHFRRGPLEYLLHTATRPARHIR